MDDDQVARGAGLSSSYVFVVALFIAAVLDVTMFNGGFLVSEGYRSLRPAVIGGALVIALLLWLGVVRANRRNAAPVTDLPVQTVRGRGAVFQPVSAIVMLLITASIASGFSVPKHVHELIAERESGAPFTLAAAPAPERRGCREVAAISPSYGDVKLCLPAGIAAELAPGEEVWVSGLWSELGLEPRRYALNGTPEETTADDSGVGDLFNDLLETMDVKPPAAEPVPVEPEPRRVGKPKVLTR